VTPAEEGRILDLYYREVYLRILTACYPPLPYELKTHWRRRTRFAQWALAGPPIAYGRPHTGSHLVWHRMEAP